jgi:hypothetical protein
MLENHDIDITAINPLTDPHKLKQSAPLFTPWTPPRVLHLGCPIGSYTLGAPSGLTPLQPLRVLQKGIKETSTCIQTFLYIMLQDFASFGSPFGSYTLDAPSGLTPWLPLSGLTPWLPHRVLHLGCPLGSYTLDAP